MSDQGNGQSIALADGRRLGFAEYGDLDGLPVFHFHGSAGSRLDRPGRAEILQEAGVRFISVERPGHGLSDFLPKRRLVDWPADVSQLADWLRLDNFYVEGHSAGGPYALACARYLPGRVRAVALVSSAAPMNRPRAFKGLPLPNMALAASARWAPPLTGLLRWLTLKMLMRDPEQTPRRLMASIPAADKEKLYEQDNLALFVQSITEGYRSGWRGVAQDDVIVARDWGLELGAISVPVDIWHGQADVNVPFSGAQYLATVLPMARTFFLPGEGHFFILGRWREILTMLVSQG